MPESSSANPVEISELQRRMAQIRREMHEDVQGAVRGARSLTDWRSILADHPWGALSAAAGVGYLLVPHRASEPQATRGTPARVLADQGQTTRVSRSAGERFRPVSAAFSLLAPVLVRAAQNYALNYFEQWLAANPFQIKESDGKGRINTGEGGTGERAPSTLRFPDRR
jgi:hypothetical protein